jgi:hypothetical protein
MAIGPFISAPATRRMGNMRGSIGRCHLQWRSWGYKIEDNLSQSGDDYKFFTKQKKKKEEDTGSSV